jgi:hypothetical protein
MGLLLIAHLGVVLALFLTMPYGKFIHGIFRALALLNSALEDARPEPELVRPRKAPLPEPESLPAPTPVISSRAISAAKVDRPSPEGEELLATEIE